MVAPGLLLFGLGAFAWAQHGGGHGHRAPAGVEPSGTTAASRQPAFRVTDEVLHAHGGVPPGWKFAIPPGDPARGRQLFVDLECYKCHTIRGESFPAAGEDPKNVGPELTGMGSHHPPEYFAESILDPNRVIVEGPGYTGPDGLSVMPSYADSLTLAQWVDLVAYLRSLTVPGAPGHHAAEREQVAGEYRVRIVYVGHEHHGAGTPHGHGERAAQGARHGHLMVFVVDRDHGLPVPYLPVTATVHAAGVPPRQLTLAPMVNEHGFHYGTDVTLPERTERVEVQIGATTMRVGGALKGRYARRTTVSFAWAREPR
jgi:mono/diheme cytochrome c family protein